MLVAFYVPTFLFVCLGRTFLYKIFGSIRYSGSDNYTTVLVGDEQNMRDLVELMNNKWNGYRLEGVFTLETSHHYGDDVKRIGSIDDVIPYLESHHVDELFCGLPSLYKDKIVPIIDYCENNLVRFYSVPNLQNYLRRQIEMKRVGNSIVLAIRKEPLGRLRNRLLKRTFDLLISTLFLCTLYPIIYIVIGSIIKFTSYGPVYFKQARTGLDGRSFICLKFRSMCVNKQSDHLQATQNDPRITTIGHFIRHTNIDELPQFINVWKGDMSLVGPRPHMLEHTEKYSQLINHFMLRHLIKPGITGWAQVQGCRGETKEVTDMAKRVRLDIWYCENWNFWLDILIVFKTVWNMICGEKKAY
jgi:exopolysaccharide biosynthesis polyprenyl glycosylphosphotransferase